MNLLPQSAWPQRPSQVSVMALCRLRPGLVNYCSGMTLKQSFSVCGGGGGGAFENEFLFSFFKVTLNMI